MDQIKSGKFIAATRKGKQLTQRQLADILGISDKTVSKWECGAGMPEVSLMLPLCEALGISVNELLTGEKVTDADYKKKAEENMMDLVEQIRDNKKKLTLSIIIGCICIVAVLSMVLLASLLEMPTVARIVVILIAVGIMVAGIGAAAVLDREAGTFECPHCHARFVPTMDAYVKGLHTFTKRKLKCPSCGETSMCKHKMK